MRSKNPLMGSLGCTVPDTSKIQSPHAERVVLAGLLHDGIECLRVLGRTNPVTRGDFYSDPHGRLFDLCCYCSHGMKGPVLAAVYEEMLLRREWCDNPTKNDAAVWLSELFFVDPWFVDMTDWADVHDLVTPFRTWAAVAAAAKVMHLAARRGAIHAAMETIRDAVDPTGDADYIRGRGDDVATYE